MAGFGWAKWAAKKTGRTGWVLLTTAVVTLVPLVFEVRVLVFCSERTTRFPEKDETCTRRGDHPRLRRNFDADASAHQLKTHA